MKNSFNLIDEPWIPVVGAGRISLGQLFDNPSYRDLGGNPLERIALMKLLLAVAQAAATPADETAWKHLGAVGLAQKCRAYLAQWHERFYLYGDHPFLQLPQVQAAALKSDGTFLPEIATGNTTVLKHGQVERTLDDSERALLLVCQMAFALGGKKADNSVVLSPGYAGKSKSSKPGPAIPFRGLLHSFFVGQNLHETLWLNLLTTQQVEQSMVFPAGVGIAPWEQMPSGEDCPLAQALKQSLIGRLVPLSRFCLLVEEGMHCTEGIAHPNYKEGVADPTVAVDYSGKDPKVLWVDPEKRPWRELTALLGFIEQDSAKGYTSLQLQAGLGRARHTIDAFAIWSGGLRVSSNAGEQYATGSDDYVESSVWLYSNILGEIWFRQLKAEMDALNNLAKALYACVIGYCKAQKMDGAKAAAQATSQFWQLCERQFQALVDACGTDEENTQQRAQLRHLLSRYALQTYDSFCPQDTARQLDEWAKHRPNFSKYLRQEV